MNYMISKSNYALSGRALLAKRVQRYFLNLFNKTPFEMTNS